MGLHGAMRRKVLPCTILPGHCSLFLHCALHASVSSQCFARGVHICSRFLVYSPLVGEFIFPIFRVASASDVIRKSCNLVEKVSFDFSSHPHDSPRGIVVGRVHTVSLRPDSFSISCTELVDIHIVAPW